jgi:hypothetical protein
MSRHSEMPPAPLANRSNKGTGDNFEINKDTTDKPANIQHSAEQVDTATIKQNTTKKDFFNGLRMK